MGVLAGAACSSQLDLLGCSSIVASLWFLEMRNNSFPLAKCSSGVSAV